MRHYVSVILALLFVAGVCAGDIVYLKDGRKFEGTVTTAGDNVTVQTKFGPATFPKSAVDRIEKKASAEEVYAEKAKAVAVNDAKGHHELGLWCKQNGLAREARSEFEKVIAIEPENEKARAELGYTKVDGKWVQAPPGKIYAGEGEWLTPTEAFANAQAQYKLAQYDNSQKLLEAAINIGVPVEQRVDAEMLLGEICERRGKWEDASSAYERLLSDKALKTKMSPEQRTQLEVRKEIIQECKGGMYLIKEATGKEDIFTVDAKDPKAPKKELKGLQPLTDPGVMYLAMREKASTRVLKGKDYLAQAKKAMDGSEAGKKSAYALLDKADGEFDGANMIVKDIARGFQIEGVKQRMGVLEKVYSVQVAAYIGLSTGVRQPGTSREKLSATIPVLLQKLGEMEKSLQEIEQLDRRFPEELADHLAKIRNALNGIATDRALWTNLAKTL